MRQLTKADYRQAARLREAVQRFARESERTTRANGLTLQRFMLLLMVKTARNGRAAAPLSELMERLQLAQSSVVELVHRAEDLGLVRRQLSAENRRLIQVALTAEGERRLARVVKALTEDRRRLIEILAGLQ